MKRVTLLLLAVSFACTPAFCAKYGLVIAVTQTDPTKTPCSCGACANDAKAIGNLLTKAQYDVTTLISEQATCQAVLDAFSALAAKAKPEDLCVVYFSGHGGHENDKNADEKDHVDETWILYDDRLLDDDIASKWMEFAKGTRVFFISDSCNSGTVLKAALDGEAGLASSGSQQEEAVVKAVPPSPEELAKISAAWEANGYSSDYAVINPEPIPQCSIISFAACQDGAKAYMDGTKSYFTQAIVDEWRDGAFQGNFVALFSAVSKRVQSLVTDQKPNMVPWGQLDMAFQESKPFTGEPAASKDAVIPGNVIVFSADPSGERSTGTVHAVRPKYMEIETLGGSLEVPRSEMEDIKVLGIDRAMSRTDW